MTNNDVDAVIVGAGFSGLYATHRLHNLEGLTVACFEAGSGPGGVWYWNRYPGARCDFESIYYSFTFDEGLQREWRWKERFASQPEIMAYLEHVADRFDLRRNYQFNTRVTSAVWDDEAQRWVIGTDDGAVTTARFFINAAGAFSVFKKNDFPGQADFRGTVLHTSQWPADGVDLAGKRVAVIGTGSTGIQVIQTIAPRSPSSPCSSAPRTSPARSAIGRSPTKSSPRPSKTFRPLGRSLATVWSAPRTHEPCARR